MSIKKQLNEDVAKSIFDTVISDKELHHRKVTLARVLAKAEEAVTAAENAGDAALVDKLRDRIDLLQELFDKADEIELDADEESAVSSDSSDSKSESDPDKSKSGPKKPDGNPAGNGGSGGDDSGESGESGESSESDKSGESAKSDKSDETGESGESSESDEADESGDSGDSGDSGESGASSDSGESGKSEASSESGESGESSESDEPDESDESSESDESGETGESSESGDSGEPDPTKEPDDYPKRPKPTIKDGKVLIDPFRKMPPVTPEFAPPDDAEVETTFEAAKRMLSKLTGESRNGAVQGLKDLLSGRGIFHESLKKSKLQEAITKTLAQMSDEEFGDEIRKTMDLVDQIIKVDYSDDLDVRVKEIEHDASSPIARAELEREDAEHVKADRKAVKAARAENEKYKKFKALDGLDRFKASLYRAIADQVEMAEDEVDSWAALDRRHEDDPNIIVKGHILDDVPGNIPSVTVYFDQSGSWSNYEIDIGKRAISVINEFHEKGEINLDIKYMSAAGVFDNAASARADGSAEGWHAALSDIKSSKVKNVIVLSDDDLDHFLWSNRPSGDNGRTIIDGCVWWLWKNNRVSKTAPKELVGRRGNFHYAFTTTE